MRPPILVAGVDEAARAAGRNGGERGVDFEIAVGLLVVELE